jgi:hypothetical protein
MSSSALGFLMLMTLPLLGGNDLLDLTASDAYWKSRGVERSVAAMLSQLQPKAAVDISALIKQLGADEFRQREAAMKAIRAAGPSAIDQLRKAAEGSDAEIADRAATLIKQLGAEEVSSAERRLMAIRTLGELKQPEAVPHLKKMLASDEPFVAEYAEAAIASIEGRSFERPRPTQQQRDEDLHLLPKECVFVLQAGAEHRVAMSWEQILKQVALLPNGMERDATIETFKRSYRTLLERAGNVRIDLVTVGVAGHLFTDAGFVVVVFRGKYHAQGFVQEAKKLGLAHARVGGFDVVEHPTDKQAAVILASDSRMVLVASPSGALPIAEVAATLKRGRGTFAENAKLVDLVGTVDRSKAVWAATMPDAAYLGLLGIEGLESMTLEVAQDKEALAMTCRVRASDVGKMKQQLDEAMKFRDNTLPGLKTMLVTEPHYKPLVDLCESLKLTADGNVFTFTARAPSAAALLTFPVVEGRRAVE